jgi:hypothetical protein
MIILPITLSIISVKIYGEWPFVNGFYLRMQQRLDVSSLRIWLEELDDEIFKEEENQFHDVLAYKDSLDYRKDGDRYSITIPQEIRDLSENVHYLTFYKENHKRCIRIEWGGPFARWGVVIGPKGMPIPETVDVSYDEMGYRNIGEYRIRLEDGAYVWHEIK